MEDNHRDEGAEPQQRRKHGELAGVARAAIIALRRPRRSASGPIRPAPGRNAPPTPTRDHRPMPALKQERGRSLAIFLVVLNIMCSGVIMSVRGWEDQPGSHHAHSRSV